MKDGEPAPPGARVPAKGGVPKGRRWLLPVLLAVLLLGASGAGAAWYAGLLPIGPRAAENAAETGARPPVFVDIPEIIANLNGSARRPVYVKLRARLEVSRPQDAQAAQAAMPRLLDLFNTFLRETRPEELRGSLGMHRLREELLARANIALREGSATDVLFLEIVVQ